MSSKPHIIAIQVGVIFLIIGILVGPKVMQALQGNDAPIEQQNTITQAVPTTTPPNIFGDISLSGKSAFVWDIKEHRKIYGKNEYEKLPLASVTKIMMALVALEQSPKDKVVTISATDLREDGDHGLRTGERWRLDDLISFTLVTSSNDGASAIAAVAGVDSLNSPTSATEHRKRFVEMMNDKARSIGLLDTNFSNETGLDLKSYQSGAYGTARDMAMLYEYIWRKHPSMFEATTKKEQEIRSLSGVTHQVFNTNDFVEHVPGLIGSKTGFTDLAGGNLVIITDIGIDRPVVIAVLGSTRNDRFSDVEKLRDRAIRTIATSK